MKLKMTDYCILHPVDCLLLYIYIMEIKSKTDQHKTHA